MAEQPLTCSAKVSVLEVQVDSGGDFRARGTGDPTADGRDAAAECRALVQQLRPLLLYESLLIHARDAFQGRVLALLPTHLPRDWGVAIPLASVPAPAAGGASGVVVLTPGGADEDPSLRYACAFESPLRNWDIWNTRYLYFHRPRHPNPRYVAALRNSVMAAAPDPPPPPSSPAHRMLRPQPVVRVDASAPPPPPSPPPPPPPTARPPPLAPPTPLDADAPPPESVPEDATPRPRPPGL